MRHNVEVIKLQSPNQIISALVYPEFGGRVGSLTLDSHELFISSADNNDPLSWGCYPMVPYAGRVRNGLLNFGGDEFSLRKNLPPHSIHGTVFDQSWFVVSHSSSTALLETDLGPEWPFVGTVQHHIEITNNGIELQLNVNAKKSMPIQVGWHPWFVKPDRTELHFGAMLQRDTVGIATEVRIPQPTTHVDDCFVDPEKPLTITIGTVQVTLSSDCSHWVLYDMPPHATCIEPQSGPPNGINAEPLVLSGNSILTKKFIIDLQKIA